MRPISALLVFTLAALASSCGSDATAPPISALEGSWSRLDEIPGSSEQWSIALTGDAVSGTGSWSGEACCGGPLSIVGSVSGDSIHLNVTLAATVGNPAPDHHEHFDGVLISSSELRGKSTFDGGVSGTVRFHKQ